jgi:hypothetical protein
MTSPTTIWQDRIILGKRKEDASAIFLSAPSWDCDWYWGFGYLGNNSEHYHLSSYSKKDKCIKDSEGKYHVFTIDINKNMYDCLLEDYDLNPKIEQDLWTFCELVKTACTLKEAAEVLHRGGSNYTTNSVADIVKDTDKCNHINKVVLPAIFDEFIKTFG